MPHKCSENEQTVHYKGVWNDGKIVGTRQIGETSDVFHISPQKTRLYCYLSRPVFLGYGVNNSATYMHIIGVMYIQELLKKPKVRILDVGCGSGFVTAVLALAAQDPEIVLGVDHIEDFVQKGYQLIEWFVPQLSNRISFKILSCCSHRYLVWTCRSFPSPRRPETPRAPEES